MFYMEDLHLVLRFLLAYQGCWHFDNGASKIDDVLTEHGELLHVLSLAVQMKFSLTYK